MQSVWYLILWALTGLGALIAGGVSHYAQAHFSAYAPRLFDGNGVGDLLLNETLSPSHNPLGDYDEGGWWRFESLRNYALHAGGWLLLVIVAGVINWPHQGEVIAAVCRSAGWIGSSPVFCG